MAGRSLDDIMDIAKQLGFRPLSLEQRNRIVHFFNEAYRLGAQEEREACIEICKNEGKDWGEVFGYVCAQAIDNKRKGK